MPILVDNEGTRFQESDPQNIYNAIKSGNYKLEAGSSLVLRGDEGKEAFQLDSQNGDINQQLTGLLENGYRFETKGESFQRLHPELSGMTGNVMAGTASLINTGLFGIPAMAASGTKAGEYFQGLTESHPISSMIGDVAGVVTNFTPAGLVANTVGKAAGAAASGLGKIAALGAEGATVGALSSVPLGITEASFGEPGRASEILLSHMGTGALLGAIANPVLGVAAPKIADLFSSTSKTATNLTNEGLGAITSKLADMTPEQQQVFNNLVKDPEARKLALSMSKDIEDVTIKSTVEDLSSLSKLVKEDIKGIYDTKFNSILKNIDQSQVMASKQEMIDLIKEAKNTMRLNPESYDSTFLKSLTAAEKTLDVRGAVNIGTRKTIEEALQKLAPEARGQIDEAFNLAKAKAIKEARTEIGYKAPFDAAKVGIDRTGALANKLYEDMSTVANKLYGNEFVKISDTYSATKDVLDNIKKVAFNSDGTVNYNKVKNLISDNKASELKLDDLLDKVSKLQALSGKEYNFGSKLSDTLESIRNRQTVRSFGKGLNSNTPDLINSAGMAGLIAPALDLSYGGVAAATHMFRMMKNPRASLQMMNFLENAQVATANKITQIAKFSSNNAAKIAVSHNIRENWKQKEQEIIKDVKVSQTVTNLQVVDKGVNDTLGLISKIAPQTAGMIKAKVAETASFLESKQPKIATDPLTSEQRVMDSMQKVQQYLIYKNAVNDPLNALKEVSRGINLEQNREVLQTLYPSIWNQYMQIKLQSIQGKDLPHSERRQINEILGLRLDEFSLPTVSNNVLQYNREGQQGKPIYSNTSPAGNTDRLKRP